MGEDERMALRVNNLRRAINEIFGTSDMLLLYVCDVCQTSCGFTGLRNIGKLAMARRQVLYMIPHRSMCPNLKWHPNQDGDQYFNMFKLKTMGDASSQTLDKCGNLAEFFIGKLCKSRGNVENLNKVASVNSIDCWYSDPPKCKIMDQRWNYSSNNSPRALNKFAGHLLEQEIPTKTNFYKC